MSEHLPNNPVLSILIVNYNGRKFLGPCLESVRKYVSCRHEVIVVDNASQDDSVEFIRKNFPEVVMISSPQNLGFAKGNNLAARQAKGSYLLLLNMDTVLIQDIAPVAEALERNPKLGVLGIKMLGVNKEYRNSCGFFPSGMRLLLIRSIFNRRGFFADGCFPQNSAKVYEVDWVEGSFLVTPKKLWDMLGGMDENYFMYVEDVDYCRSAKNAGYQTGYFPQLSFIHFGGYSDLRLAQLLKGYRRFFSKFSSPAYAFYADGMMMSGLFVKTFIYGLAALFGSGQARTKFQHRMAAIKEIIVW